MITVCPPSHRIPPRLLILCTLSLNPVFPSHVCFLCLFICCDIFPPCVVYFCTHLCSLFICLLEDLVFSNHPSAIISISPPSLSSLSLSIFLFFINITICLSGIPLFSLIWWLIIHTHMVLIGWANGTAAADSHLRRRDVEESCSSLLSSHEVVCVAASLHHLYTLTILIHWSTETFPRHVMRSASCLTCLFSTQPLRVCVCVLCVCVCFPRLYSNVTLQGTMRDAIWQMLISLLPWRHTSRRSRSVCAWCVCWCHVCEHVCGGVRERETEREGDRERECIAAISL